MKSRLAKRLPGQGVVKNNDSAALEMTPGSVESTNTSLPRRMVKA